LILSGQRGYGTSDKPRGVNAYVLDQLASDVGALADTLGRPGFRLVGHDWGGVAAWETAMRFPNRVERIHPRLSVLTARPALPSQAHL
jgi:pimeloyl-ACP methyl ester carboxylesterase